MRGEIRGLTLTADDVRFAAAANNDFDSTSAQTPKTQTCFLIEFSLHLHPAAHKAAKAATLRRYIILLVSHCSNYDIHEAWCDQWWLEVWMSSS